MKSNCRYSTGSICSVLILVCAISFTGCISGSQPQQSAVATPVVGETPIATGTTGVHYATTTARLPDGVTITYPSDWQKEETSETSMRDYGRITTNIANFYSPDISPERAQAGQPNVDTSRYTTLSIDVDPSPVTDFEQYFNLVTIALQKKYGHIDITKHNYQLKISKTTAFDGYKSYQMDFDTTNLRGSYIFTNVDGTVYIFAFRNPSPYSAEVQDMYMSVRIVPPAADQQKHR